MNSVVRPSREIPEAGTAPGQSALLTEDQWTRLRALTRDLAPAQALWLSGYFAGLSHSTGTAAALIEELTTPADEIPPRRKVTILYGSETGNSTAIAQSLADQVRALDLVVTISDMGEYKPRELKGEEDLLIVTSTYGEGDPPSRAIPFFDFLEGRKAPSLPNVRYAVLALGDTAYEFFCEAGRRIDRRLEELGAKRVCDRVDCDIDYDDPAAAWSAAVLAALDEKKAASDGKSSLATGGPSATLLKDHATFDKRKPFMATVIGNNPLTGRGSSKETRHIEFSLGDSGLTFEPGDALGILAQNDPAIVSALVDTLGLQGQATVTVKDQSFSLSDALTHNFEITTATPRFLELWASLTSSSELQRLISAENGPERTAFLHSNHIIDVIRRFPLKLTDPQTLLTGLRPLQPRLYSIASSLSALPDEVHLTVATVRYVLNNEQRSGVASGGIADRLAVDSTSPIYIHQNDRFRLPGDDIPMIMIGAGTGVAPFRAFIQEREIRSSTGKSWLFFGERNFRTDFLYQAEWQQYLKDEVLTRMDVAFSRDRAEKHYVQHAIKERGHDVYAWLHEGAYLYICGDATHMAVDVNEALISVIAEHGAMGRTAAEDYLRGLQRDSRFQQDVY